MIRFAISLIVSVLILSLVLFYLFKDSLQILIVSCFFSTGIILTDTFLRNPLMKVSILGYDPIAGSRFYGIGNEYMGFLLGTTIIGTAALIDKYRDKGKIVKILSVTIYMIVLTLMAPTLGTTVGAQCIRWVGTATMLYLKGRITKMDDCLSMSANIPIFPLYLRWNEIPGNTISYRPNQFPCQTNSLLALFQIFRLSMNYKLIRYTWTWALLPLWLHWAYFRWPVGILKDLSQT